MKDSKSIIEEYQKFATQHWNSSRVGDYKTSNSSYVKLKKLFKIFFNNQQLREEILPQLLNDNSYCVQLWAASHCLGIGIYIDESLLKLEQISKLKESEAPSFEAKMMLHIWKEKGVLTF